jgi:hypothetical protein
MVGVFSEELGETYARVLAELGHRRAFVVHGTDGMDEVTLSAPTIVWDVRKGVVKRYLFDPRSVGFEYASTQDLKGGDAATNASILKGILSGAKGPGRQATLLNAAFAIVAGGKAEDVGKASKGGPVDRLGAPMSRLERFSASSGARGLKREGNGLPPGKNLAGVRRNWKRERKSIRRPTSRNGRGGMSAGGSFARCRGGPGNHRGDQAGLAVEGVDPEGA